MWFQSSSIVILDSQAISTNIETIYYAFLLKFWVIPAVETIKMIGDWFGSILGDVIEMYLIADMWLHP